MEYDSCSLHEDADRGLNLLQLTDVAGQCRGVDVWHQLKGVLFGDAPGVD